MKLRAMMIAAAMLCMVSCQSKPDFSENVSSTPAAQDIARAVEVQAEKAGTVADNSNSIVKGTKDIVKETDQAKVEVSALRPTADSSEIPRLDRIDTNLDNIEKTANTIKTEAIESHDAALTIQNQVSNIRDNNKDIIALETKVKELEKANDANQQDAQKKWYTMLAAAGALGGSMVVGGLLWAFFVPTGRKAGLAIAGCGFLIGALALAATVYFKTIALIGLYIFVAGVLVTLGTLAYHVLHVDKKNVELKTATVENTRIIETLKQELPEDTVVEYFGDKAKPGLVQTMQSPKTKDLVADIRANILKKEISQTIPKDKA